MSEIVIDVIKTLIPLLFLIFGGQWILNRYEITKKAKEQEMELICFVRQQQYEAVETLYNLFAEFMALYREINNSSINLQDIDTQNRLLQRAIKAESEVDALILRIGCEFASETEDDLEELLGHLRQSVQLWREKIEAKEKLPFYGSKQSDYVQFKETFAGTAAFMVHQIHNRLDPPDMRIQEAKSMLIGVFSNRDYID